MYQNAFMHVMLSHSGVLVIGSIIKVLLIQDF